MEAKIAAVDRMGVSVSISIAVDSTLTGVLPSKGVPALPTALALALLGDSRLLGLLSFLPAMLLLGVFVGELAPLLPAAVFA